MAQVLLEQLSKTFPGDVRAVNAITLSIPDREFVVLVGPSGCGKSTTLRMIAGLEEITSGVIRIGDRIVNDLPPKDRDIAMVFQNYALYPHMTVFQNMAFGLKLRKTPKDQILKRVTDAAKMLEIEHLLQRKPKALSGGQRQRVAVGRAIVREPAAFLFDEPLSNLDAKLRVTTRAELKRLHARLQTTTIHVTHDQEEAMTLGDRIVVMKDGRIQQAATPLDTYHFPCNRFVAGFIGMPPMNFFDGTIRSVDGKLMYEEGIINAGNQLTFTGNGFNLSIPMRWRDALSSRLDRHLVLGIRPEHLHLQPVENANADESLEMTLTVIEPLGNTMDLYMQTNLNGQLVARVGASAEMAASLRGQARVSVYVDPRKIHFFEPGETGMNLGLSRDFPSLGLTSELSHALA